MAFGPCGIIVLPRVRLQVSSVFSPGNFQGFALVNQQRTSRISTGFTVEVSTEGTQLSYSNFDYLGQEPHYWQLPDTYQGDKVSTEHLGHLPPPPSAFFFPPDVFCSSTVVEATKAVAPDVMKSERHICLCSFEQRFCFRLSSREGHPLDPLASSWTRTH